MIQCLNDSESNVSFGLDCPARRLGGGCVGSWGEAGQFFASTQDCSCNVYTSPGLFLPVTAITILCDWICFRL
jgi:hypothetical protein